MKEFLRLTESFIDEPCEATIELLMSESIEFIKSLFSNEGEDIGKTIELDSFSKKHTYTFKSSVSLMIARKISFNHKS